MIQAPLSTFFISHQSYIHLESPTLGTAIHDLVLALPEAAVNSNGRISYIPVLLLDRTGDMKVQERTTTLTRLVLWYLDQYKKRYGVRLGDIPANALQKVQDLIVRWAAENANSSEWSFEEVTGPEIIKAYATGPHSCMAGKTAQLALYVQNPEKVALLKIYQKGAYKGRAILWTLDDGRRMLDRIYPGNGTLAFAARSYARSNGWLFHSTDSVGAGIKLEQVFCTLKHVNNRRIPYLDNMFFVYDCSQDHLTLTNKGSRDGYSLVMVGGYEGYEHRIYANARTLDGQHAVRPYKLTGSGYRFQPVHPVPYHNGRRLIQAVIRPGDPVVYNRTHGYFMHQDRLVQVGERIFRRNDVRKVRNRNEFIPKPDAVAFIEAGEYNGYRAIIAEVEGLNHDNHTAAG